MIGERIPEREKSPSDENRRSLESEEGKKAAPKKKKRDDSQLSMEPPVGTEPAKPYAADRSAEWAQAPDGEENLWKRDDVPHEGWICCDVIDLGEPVGVCRMCGHQIIRYVHVMRHSDYPRTVGAGCVCAGRMEGDPEAAKAREAAFKNRQARRETFLSAKLKRSRKGNEYTKYKGELITLLPDRFRPGYWKTALREEYSPSYPTREEALSAAFDILDPWEGTGPKSGK